MTPAEELALLHTAAGLVDREGHAAVLVSGPDTFTFLQAIVSADLDPLGDGDGVRSLLLQPQGKLDVAFRLLRVGDDAWLDADPGTGAGLVASLLRFRIRVQVDVVDRTAAWRTLSVVGPGAVAAVPVALPDAVHAHVEHHGAHVVRTEAGFDVLGPATAVGAIEAAIVSGGVAPVGAATYEAFRIEHGIPVQPLDIDDATIPQEAFLEREAVSFSKGCFVGQELVCRIDTRGHVNRFLRRLVDVEGPWPSRGDEIVVDGRVVGTVTSVSDRAYGVGALAVVRREVEPPVVIEVRTGDGPATARLVAID